MAQILLLAGLYYGFALARRKDYTRHANVQTAMVLLNLLLIAFMMVPSFWEYIVIGGRTTGLGPRLTIVHGALGLVVEVAALFLILQMRTKVIPQPFRIGNIKLAMRATLALWTVVVLMGLGIYVVGYLLPRAPVS